MREIAEEFDVGVIIGRFQVPELHEGHRDLIQHVCDQHDKVIIFLGLSPLMNTTNNPLDFESRKQMLQEAFPNVIIGYLHDQATDIYWSRQLDKQIAALTTPRQSVLLYGARDSFIKHYSGGFATKELEAERVYSGTAERKRIAAGSTRGTPDFRAGVTWAAMSRFPTAYTTVDIAILNEDGQKILLCRKPNVTTYQFVGGFSDPASESFEQDARREVHEETGLDISDPKYIGSCKIDDWRYRSEVDCIKTMLFVAKVVSGRPKAQDDIEEVRWFDLSNCELPATLASIHRPLLEMLLNHFAKTSKGA